MKIFLMKAWMNKEQMKGKIKAFLQDETSARGSVEEGYLTYAGVVVGIIVLGIVIYFSKDAFTAIGKFFNDGVTGKVTNPTGWGK